MGSMETIVVSNGSLPPALTRLPSVSSALLIRPSMSAVIREYSRSSWARAISFLAPLMLASRALASASAFSTCWVLAPPFFFERLETGFLLVGRDFLGFENAQFVFVASDIRFKRPRILLEKESALFDYLAVSEVDLLDVTADAGANLDLLVRRHPAIELFVIGQGAMHRVLHGNFGRFGSWWWRLGRAAD